MLNAICTDTCNCTAQPQRYFARKLRARNKRGEDFPRQEANATRFAIKMRACPNRQQSRFRFVGRLSGRQRRGFRCATHALQLCLHGHVETGLGAAEAGAPDRMSHMCEEARCPTPITSIVHSGETVKLAGPGCNLQPHEAIRYLRNESAVILVRSDSRASKIKRTCLTRSKERHQETEKRALRFKALLRVRPRGSTQRSQQTIRSVVHFKAHTRRRRNKLQ